MVSIFKEPGTLQSQIMTKFILENKVLLLLKEEILVEYQDQFEDLSNQVVSHDKSLTHATAEVQWPSSELQKVLLTKMKKIHTTEFWPIHLLKLMIWETIILLFEMKIVKKISSTHQNFVSSIQTCECVSSRVMTLFLMEDAKEKLNRLCNPYLNTELALLLAHGSANTAVPHNHNEIPSVFFYLCVYMMCLFILKVYYQLKSI